MLVLGRSLTGLIGAETSRLSNVERKSGNER